MSRAASERCLRTSSGRVDDERHGKEGSSSMCMTGSKIQGLTFSWRAVAMRKRGGACLRFLATLFTVFS